MHVHIRATHGPVEVSADDEDVAFRLGGRKVAIDWGEIVGAGLARRPGVPTQVPKHETELLPGPPRQLDIIPFGSRLADLAGGTNATHRALVVASRCAGFAPDYPLSRASHPAVVRCGRAISNPDRGGTDPRGRRLWRRR